MIIGKQTAMTLAGGVVLSLAFAAPLQAQNNDDVKDDPTTVEVEGEEDAMTAEELERKAEEVAEDAEEATEEMAEDAEEAMEEAGEKMEAAGEKIEEGAEAAAAAVVEVADDDEAAAELQQMIADDPQLGVYGLDVIEIDGRYQVTGRIDKSEDYARLERMVGDYDGIDADAIDINVVQD